jgi:hypothetical protein
LRAESTSERQKITRKKKTHTTYELGVEVKLHLLACLVNHGLAILVQTVEVADLRAAALRRVVNALAFRRLVFLFRREAHVFAKEGDNVADAHAAFVVLGGGARAAEVTAESVSESLFRAIRVRHVQRLLAADLARRPLLLASVLQVLVAVLAVAEVELDFKTQTEVVRPFLQRRHVLWWCEKLHTDRELCVRRVQKTQMNRHKSTRTT